MKEGLSPTAARFRHSPFLDLLADAAHGYRRAKNEVDPYEINRASRASIISSCLSIESLANCLLVSINVQSQLAQEIDKMPVLAKFDLLLSLKGLEPLDRGAAAVQRISELVKLRNEYVHPKISTAPADLRPFEETESHFLVPFSVTTDTWPSLKIPKYSLVWNSDAAANALKALASFYSCVLVDKLKTSDEELVEILLSRFEFAHLLMPGVHEEYATEINALKDDGIDFSFLKI